MYLYLSLQIKQVQGQVSYNGYRLDEFVPRKTSAYISQNDLHLGDLTVKETFDYSARFQGVGHQYGNKSYEILTRSNLFKFI